MKTSKNKEYGRRVSAIRHFLGMTQAQLASELELAVNTLGNYERGETRIPAVVWDRLQSMAPEMFKNITGAN